MPDPTISGNEWMQAIPFYCLVTDAMYRKPLVARILESAITAGIAAIGGGYFAIAIATTSLQEKQTADHALLIKHIDEDQAALERHEQQEREERREIMQMLHSMNECLRNRTCTR